MNIAVRAAMLLLLAFAGCGVAVGQIPNFRHIVVMVQENRTPDNLFQGLCLPPYGHSQRLRNRSESVRHPELWLRRNRNADPTVPRAFGQPP